jgi:hypothetical protein
MFKKKAIESMIQVNVQQTHQLLEFGDDLAGQVAQHGLNESWGESTLDHVVCWRMEMLEG